MRTAPTRYLYTVTNDTKQNGVAVLGQNVDGSLTEVAGSPFSAGGKGLSGGDIDQQGAIRVHDLHVLAVNPGSDSIAVFHKGDGGRLTPVAGSPFPSGGSTPLSLTVHTNLVYVANQAAEFAKPKPSSPPNIVCFRISNRGKLTPVPTATINFPAGYGPAQVEFNPKGEILAVTSGFQDDATTNLHVYKVQMDGALKEGPGSPIHTAGASGSVGFSWNPEGNRVYVSNSFGDAVTVFDVDKSTGGVKQVGNIYKTHGTAPCWTVLSSDGKTLYVANFISNSISVFDVHADGELIRLGTAKRRGATDPDTKDLVLPKEGKFLYAVGSGRRNISIFSIGANRKLTELPKDKSPLKLRAGKNILGLATD